MPSLYALPSVPNALLQRRLRFRSPGMRGFVAACAGGAAGLALAVWGWGQFSLLGISILQQVAQALNLWPVVRWRPHLAMRREHLAEVLAFTRHAVAVNLMVFVDQQASRVAVGAFLGAGALRFFTMAWRLIETISTLTTMSVSQAAIPIISRGAGRGNQPDPPFILRGRPALLCRSLRQRAGSDLGAIRLALRGLPFPPSGRPRCWDSCGRRSLLSTQR